MFTTGRDAIFIFPFYLALENVAVPRLTSNCLWEHNCTVPQGGKLILDVDGVGRVWAFTSSSAFFSFQHGSWFQDLQLSCHFTHIVESSLSRS